MNLLHAIILGVIQGLTEFLPVSSTAHLEIIPWLLRWAENPSKAFDIALHIGTLIALVIYFWHDIVDVLTHRDRRLLWLVVVGCLPLPVAALVEKKAEYFSDPHQYGAAPLVIAGALIAFAILLKWADATGRKKKPVEKLTYGQAFFIGIGQIIAAILPGASRSGTTMTFGLMNGLTREAAVRYSFLLSIPTIAGVALYDIAKHHRELTAGANGSAVLAGIVASGIVGYAAIAFLMGYVRRNSLDVFFWYRIVAGVAIIALYFARK